MGFRFAVVGLLLLVTHSECGSLKVMEFKCIPFTDKDVEPWIVSTEKDGVLSYYPTTIGDSKEGVPTLSNSIKLGEARTVKDKVSSWDTALEGNWQDRGPGKEPTFKPKDQKKYDEFTAALDKDLMEPNAEINEFQSANMIQAKQYTNVKEGLGDCQISASIGEKSIKVPTTAKFMAQGEEHQKSVKLKLRLLFMKMTVCKTASLSSANELGESALFSKFAHRKNGPRPSHVPTTGVFSQPGSVWYIPKEDDPVRVTKCEVKQTMLGLYGCKAVSDCLPCSHQRAKNRPKCKEGADPSTITCDGSYVPCLDPMKNAFAAFM